MRAEPATALTLEANLWDTTAEARCLGRYVSYAEEPEFVPALRVYLSGCNFRCRFCNVAPLCFARDRGEPVVPAALAHDCEAALAAGVQTISLLGGEPSRHASTILAVAAAASRPLPLVLNTNGYFSATTRAALHEAIQTWIVDFKFGNNDCAKHLAGVDAYLETVTPNLVALGPGGRSRIRHLLIPGHVECCFKPIVRWVSRNLPGARFHLTTGYVPAWQARHNETLGGVLTRDEVRRALEYLEGTNLAWSTDGNDARS